MIPFGSFEPDQPISVTGVSRNVAGVVPIADNETGVSYGPYSSLVDVGGATALAEDPRGVISIVTSAGTNRVFVGQSTSIVEMDSAWAPTNIDTGLSLTADDDWSFEHYGSYLIATNTTYGMWAYNVDSSSGAGALANAPKARQVTRTNEVLIATDCDGVNRQWQNCAMGDHTNWSTLEATYDTLEGGGALIGCRDMGIGSALMFQDDAINILTFGQSTALFTVRKLGTAVGSVGERSIVSYGGIVYGLHTQGFFATNGAEVRWIGNNKIDGTFLAGIATADMHLVQGAYDPFNKLIMWYYNGTIWCYNWTLDRWSTITQSLNALMQIGTPGWTSDTADALGNVDTVGMPGPDARFWQGGSKILGAFGTGNKIGFFSGDNYASTIDTVSQNLGGSSLIRSATPLTDDSDATLAIGVTDVIGSSLTYGSDVTRQNSGRVPIRGRGKNIGFRQKHAAGGTWTFSRGVDHLESAAGGKQ